MNLRRFDCNTGFYNLLKNYEINKNDKRKYHHDKLVTSTKRKYRRSTSEGNKAALFLVKLML